MRTRCLVLFCAALMLLPPRAAADLAGRFDYWLLAVTWMPSWCALEGDARGDARCASAARWGLHGLWPQYESGWPEYCRSPHPDPSRSDTAAQAGLFGASGLAWHQWRKHGRCSGLSPSAYYAASAEALQARILPDLEAFAGTATVPAIRLAGLVRRADSTLGPLSQVAVCREGYFLEIRFCLDRDFGPRACGADVIERACRAPVRLPPPG
ncbi:MAG: ribonuclease T [Rhodobacteraceae bacterium]|nr:ribonuclease T [Paracoccaceae bacterium]